jgi:hypothetical protein
MDDNIIASRSLDIPEYNENVIYSLRLNKLTKDMATLLEEAFKESDVSRIFSEISLRPGKMEANK